MKFGSDVLLEIMDIVRRGIAEGIDVSQALRELDVEFFSEESGGVLLVRLSDSYLEKLGRRR